MANFAELESAAPPIAAFMADKLTEAGLCFVATVRSDGWPRVSPMEAFVHDGHLFMGSMPHAVKAQDLKRDGRCCVITPLADKDDVGGEAKLYCRAREIDEQDEYETVRASFKESRGYDMGEMGGSHLFTFDIQGAAWQRVQGDEWRTTSWSADGGVRERTRRGDTGESIDL